MLFTRGCTRTHVRTSPWYWGNKLKRQRNSCSSISVLPKFILKGSWFRNIVISANFVSYNTVRNTSLLCCRKCSLFLNKKKLCNYQKKNCAESCDTVVKPSASSTSRNLRCEPWARAKTSRWWTIFREGTINRLNKRGMFHLAITRYMPRSLFLLFYSFKSCAVLTRSLMYRDDHLALTNKGIPDWIIHSHELHPAVLKEAIGTWIK